jgi:hypothetical protein
MYARIRKHGEALLRIFPDATEADPVKLCKTLRRWESQANNRACDRCNGAIDSEHWECISDRARRSVNTYLGTDRVWINGDPRGYALKVDLAPGEHLLTDWGGYGIIAPDLS